QGTDIEIVGVNDLTSTDVLAHMLKYDSVLGKLDAEVGYDENSLTVGGKTIRAISERDPAQLPWGELGADGVTESTGIFTKHGEAGAKTVIMSAPATDEDITVVMGVNDDAYDPAKHTIISTASCTTNCVAPMVKVLLDNFGISRAPMTTIHAYPSEQQLLDQ